jgi:class 3 adenylate cyclase
MEARLCNAAYLGNIKEINHLINAGISHSCVDYLSNSPLHIAVENGHHGVVEYLLKSTANVDCKNMKGETPLSIAIRKKKQFLKQMLLIAGDLLSSSIENHLSGVSFTIIQACPAPIASALLSGREIEPISRPMVSLFYSDIVGFTQLSSRLTADKVSRLLSTLVALFDRLAYLHGVQKIDVIGDAYIAATNFTEHQPDDHAARLARFAVAAVAAARTVPIDADQPDASAGRLEVRVGMHCGPCKGIVANLGAPKYSLIGKTARVAARMESSGAAGMVQCSAASARLIARQGHDIELRPRCHYLAFLPSFLCPSPSLPLFSWYHPLFFPFFLLTAFLPSVLRLPTLFSPPPVPPLPRSPRPSQ